MANNKPTLSNYIRLTIKALRPFSKQDANNFRKVAVFLDEYNARVVSKYIKQNKCNLKFKKIGLSFLITHNDLQPVLESGLKNIKKINKTVDEKFKEDIRQKFTERAWQITQEYVGSNILGLRKIKQLLTLMLFSEPLRIQLINISNKDRELLVDIFARFGQNLEANFSKKAEKGFDFVFAGERFQKNRFTEMAERIISGQKHKLNIEDIDFLKKYIFKAKKLKPELSPDLAEKTKQLVVSLKNYEKSLKYKVTESTVSGIMNLLKASARLELRTEIQTKDLERVFSILKEKAK